MGILNAIWGGFKAALGPLGTIIEGWQKRKTAELENKLKLAEAATLAKINYMERQQQADIAWENTALAQTGIKDEVMMAVVLIPMLMCFFPGGAALVKQGFTAMKESLPGYWEYAFYATIAVSYGIRKFVDIKSIANGATPTLIQALLPDGDSEGSKADK